MSNTRYYTITPEDTVKHNLLQLVEVTQYHEVESDDGPEMAETTSEEMRPVVAGVVFDPWFEFDEDGDEKPIWIRCSSEAGWFSDYPFVRESE